MVILRSSTPVGQVRTAPVAMPRRAPGKLRRLALLALVLVVLIAQADIICERAAELLGPAPTRYRVSRGPYALAIGDVDGDTRLDLVAAGSWDNTVSVLLAVEAGSFAPAETLPVGENPMDVKTGDLDNDGALDIVVVNRDSDSVTVLRGNGEGGFPHSLDIGTGVDPQAVAIGDLDLDGVQDLIVAHGGGLSLFSGDGAGNFSHAEDFLAGSVMLDVEIADLDLDGVPDILATSISGQSAHLLLGNGTGGFIPASQTVVGAWPRSPMVADFNLDGFPDVALANYFGHSVSILIGDGLGGLQVSLDLPAPDVHPWEIAGGDFNEDGKPDLAVTFLADDRIDVLLGNGLGGFTKVREIRSAGDGTAGISAADMDLDGALDLVVAAVGSATVTFLPGDNLAGFGIRVAFESGNAPYSVAAGDYDLDGAPDLAVVNRLDDNVRTLLGDGQGRFQAGALIPVGADPFHITQADLNNDGFLDLAVANAESDSITVLLNDGQSGFETTELTLEPESLPTFVAAADFNADGLVDLLAANYYGASMSLVMNQGNGNFDMTSRLFCPSFPYAIAVDDFNRDGNADFAVAHFGIQLVSVHLGNGRGEFARAPDLHVNDRPKSIFSGDLDADLIPDLAIAHYGNSSALTLLGDGMGGFAPSYDEEIGGYPSAVTAGDFNADGAVDLVIAKGGSDSVSVLVGDGDGDFFPTAELAAGSGGTSVAVADFDLDGTPDVALPDALSTRVHVLFGSHRARADLNGSNRIDGFDIAAVSRLGGTIASDPDYRRSADVDLNGTIDGSDLAIVATRFGESIRFGSPLRISTAESGGLQGNRVTFHRASTTSDLLTAEIWIENDSLPVAAAEFGITFEPTDGLPEPVLDLIGIEPGTYFSDGAIPYPLVIEPTPGRIDVSVERYPNQNTTNGEPESLIKLVFRAVREGIATLGFLPTSTGLGPSMLNADKEPVWEIEFTGDLQASVSSLDDDVPGRKIGVAPAGLDFGQVGPGESILRTLRISNFGYSALRILDVSADQPDFFPLFSSAFTVPAFGFLELYVEFAPTSIGQYSGDLVVTSDDPNRPLVRIPISGRSGLAVGVSPPRIDFGLVALNASRSRQVTIVNRGTDPLSVTDLQTSNMTFLATAGASSIGPGDSETIDVAFSPSIGGEQRGNLSATLVGPETGSLIVPLLAAGLADDFDDGNFSSNLSWREVNNDDFPREVDVFNGALRFLTVGAGGNGGAVGIDIALNVDVTDGTHIGFDGKAVSRTVVNGCGYSCGEYPVSVRLTLENSAGDDLRLYYALNYGDAILDYESPTTIRRAFSVEQDTWVRDLSFRIHDEFPNAVRLKSIYLYGAGWSFEGWIDNLRVFESSSTVGVSPSQLDFGAVALNASSSRQVTIMNYGTTPLSIADAQTSNTSFVATSSGSSISPGDSGTIDVDFATAIGGEQRGNLTATLIGAESESLIVPLVAAGLGDSFDDGDFSSNLSWQEVNNDDFPREVEVIDGAVRFLTVGAGGNGGTVGIEIALNVDVTSATHIGFDGKAVSRTVVGGCGNQCGEYPVSVRLTLADSAGQDLLLYYTLNYGGAVLDYETPTVVRRAFSVDQDTWVRDLSFRIHDEFPDAVRLKSIFLYGAGWSFEGWIDNVRLFENPSPSAGRGPSP